MKINLLYIFSLPCRHNTEKVVYFLLLDRKLRNPSIEDDIEIRSRNDAGKAFTFLFFSFLLIFQEALKKQEKLEYFKLIFIC